MVDDIEYLRSINDSYTQNAKQFIDLCSHEGISITTLRKYLAWLYSQNYKPQTVDIKRTAAFNRFMEYVNICNKYDANGKEAISRQLASIRKEYPKLRNKIIPVDSYNTIHKCEIGKLPLADISDRQRCFIEFLLITGARVSEMTNIKKCHCNLFGNVANIQIIGKGRKMRIVRISSRQLNNINETFNGKVYLFETQNGNPYPRQYITQEVRKITQRIFGRPLSPSKMRHSFATIKLDEGLPVDAIAKYLGHESAFTTLQYYSHNELDTEDMINMAGISTS